ncbi:MAG: NAD(P)-binding protein, partial [Candidatus Hodarchaeales archaeon]
MIPIKILGAGASGLTAAINLAKAGKKVMVFESNPSVGGRFNPNLQAVFTPKNIYNYFKEVNIEVNFHFQIIRHTRFIWVHKEDIVFDWDPIEIFFILRGGSKGSIEQGLLSQAKKLGVEVRFNARKKEEETNIVATGPRSVDGGAYGAVYNCGPQMLDDEML